MKKGYLSQYFDGVAVKVLCGVETHAEKSNQHELNGVSSFKKVLGEPLDPVRYESQYVYLSDIEENCLSHKSWATWYDARKAHPSRSEYRFYYPDNPVMDAAVDGNLLVIAKTRGGSLLFVIAQEESTAAAQLAWMFGLTDGIPETIRVRTESDFDQQQLGFAQRLILDQIGVEVDDIVPGDLDRIIAKFGVKFPATAAFSNFVRELLPDVSALDDPDAALMAWMDQEETLYRTLEKYLLSAEIANIIKSQQSAIAPDPYIKLVQSTLQRRKSRAGAALENHVEYIFRERSITNTRSGRTENKLKPDFIFPGITHYHDRNFPQERLTMLGAKTTCKDRWRQILNEAARIEYKYLLTTEPGISKNQTDEMKQEKVRLVIPAQLHSSYFPEQRNWLMNLAEFCELVKARQD